jgi:hypothetical protein
MTFTGYSIFPGFNEIGVINPAVRELAVVFNTAGLQALQGPTDDDLKWSEVAGVTPAVFRGKVPLDFTALDGFAEYKGVREYKQVDVAALQIDTVPFDRNLEWPIAYDALGNMTLGEIYNSANWARALVEHARIMKARLVASVFMQGTPSTGKALVYVGNDIPGAGLSLFATAGGGAHYANPLDPNSRKFNNYYAAAGQFDSTSYATTRKNMRLIPSPAMSAETLGLQVTDIIGPSHMEEPFRQVALSNLILQSATVGGVPVAAAPTNIYSAASTPCNFWIAPQLDGDPYVTANSGKHMWIAISRKRPGANAVEMVAPTREFTPRVQLFGDGSEMAATSQMVRMIADLRAGAAAGLPHVCARYEET